MRTNNLAPSGLPQPWEHFARAAAAYATGDRRAALRILQHITAQWPTLPSGWSQLAAAHLANDAPNSALFAALRGITMHPDHVESLAVAGCAALALRRTADAIAYLSAAAECNLHPPMVHHALVAAHVAHGDFDLAAIAGARLIACSDCTASDAIASIRRIDGCHTLARLQLPSTTARAAHTLVAAARAICARRTVPALTALNDIRTTPNCAPEYRTAARVLMTQLLRTRRPGRT